MTGSSEQPVLNFYRSSAYDVGGGPPTRRYLIVTTPRAGSTWLAMTLGATGYAGVPGEYLHPAVMKAYADGRGKPSFDLGGFLAELAPRRTTPNGAFGLKLLAGQTLFSLPEKARAAFAAELLGCFDRVIYLQRRDKVAQALSFYVAQQTNHFTMTTAADRDRLHRAQRGLSFAPEDLVRALQRIVREDVQAQELRDRADVPTLDLTYEALQADPATQFGRVFDFLGIASDPSTIDAPTYKMRDAELEAQTEAFRQWLNGQGEVD